MIEKNHSLSKPRSKVKFPIYPIIVDKPRIPEQDFRIFYNRSEETILPRFSENFKEAHELGSDVVKKFSPVFTVNDEIDPEKEFKDQKKYPKLQIPTFSTS